jgi:hypothetical protein
LQSGLAGNIRVWRYIYIPFGWLFPKKALINSLCRLRKHVLNEADLFVIHTIHTLNKIKSKHIDYNLLDNICSRYSVPKFRYKDKCLIISNNTEGELINDVDVYLWIEELGYEYSESEAIRKQNLEEIKKKLEGELLKQENIFLREHYNLIPEFSFKYLFCALGLFTGFILTILKIFNAL